MKAEFEYWYWKDNMHNNLDLFVLIALWLAAGLVGYFLYKRSNKEDPKKLEISVTRGGNGPSSGMVDVMINNKAGGGSGVTICTNAGGGSGGVSADDKVRPKKKSPKKSKKKPRKKSKKSK